MGNHDTLFVSTVSTIAEIQTGYHLTQVRNVTITQVSQHKKPQLQPQVFIKQNHQLEPTDLPYSQLEFQLWSVPLYADS
jgi:hypothetical protein